MPTYPVPIHPMRRRIKPVHSALSAVALVLGLACATTARSESWYRDILTADTFDAQTLPGGFHVRHDGGPSGEPVIEFADPTKASGTIEVDLAGVDLAHYDQLRFDLWLENDAVDIVADLHGYPDEHHARRWYVWKRFQPVGQWTDIRLDLEYSGRQIEEPDRRLVLSFTRPQTGGDDFARARVHNVRLVRSPLRLHVDYRESVERESEDGLAIAYPVHLENRTDQLIEAHLEVLPETLHRFEAVLADAIVTLEPGGRAVTHVTLTIGADHAELPAGYVERAQVRAVVPDVPGFDTVPIRGYRPVYLFGFIPPQAARNAFFERLKQESTTVGDDVAAYAGSLAWPVEKPPGDITPIHPSAFRCLECRSWLRVAGLYEYYCVSYGLGGHGSGERCPKHGQHVVFDREAPEPLWLFRALLQNYHIHNATMGRRLALGWLRTGDTRLAEKSLEILSAYEAMWRDLSPVDPRSIGHLSRFCSASLFERHLLEQWIEAWLILSESGFAGAEALQAVADGLLTEALHITNRHFYSFSASQIDMTTQALKAAVILGRWAYAADAIGGDIGVQRILDRNFDADGVPIDGGDYASQAARQIMTLARDLRALGIAVEEERVQQIEHNARLLGYLPRPKDYEMRTTVLENTGFSILVNGEGPTRRRATINWGSTRERGAQDHLTTVLHDADDRELLLRTRRVMWGHAHAFIAFQSFAQNIPVVDERNISSARLNQDYLRDDARAAGVVIADYPERPAYPDSRLTRSLVLFDGCLLVVDRFVSLAGERQIDFPLNGLARLAGQPEDMAPFEGELGQPPIYRLPHDLHTKAVAAQPFTAQWADANRGVKLHMLGDGFQAFVGKTYMGHGAQSVPRDFLMLRTRAETVTAAFLYEATHGEQPKVASFARAAVLDAEGEPVVDDQALAYDVTFDDGRTARVLISLDGGAYRSGACATDADTRIAIDTRRD